MPSAEFMEYVATLASSVSVFGWMVAGLFQVYMSIRDRNSGFSYTSLLFAITSDSFNFLGCVLTERLLFQRVEALIFLLFDSLFLVQAIYYSAKIEKIDVLDAGAFSPQSNPTGDDSSTKKRSMPLTPSSMLGLVAVASNLSSASSAPVPTATALSAGRAIATVAPIVTFPIKTAVADGCSWLAYIFNISSIVPQYLHNRRDKSTQGVSVWLYVMALLGDSGYFLSIIATSLTIGDIAERKDFVISELPFLVGTACSNMMVIAILCQYMEYGSQERGERLLDEDVPHYRTIVNG